MADNGYGPIFASLWNGSMVGRPDEQLVFIFLRCHCDSSGEVDVHPNVIASLTGIPLVRVKNALRALEAADDSSRSADLDGARIVRLDPHRDWGWQIVNHSKYLRKISALLHAERQARYRALKRQEPENPVTE